MQFPDRYPEPLKTLAQSLVGSLERSGLAVAEAERIAMDATEDYRFTHGGDAPYIPKGTLYEVFQQHQEMFNAFNGNNYDELASRYGLVPRHVRRVIAAMKRLEVQKRQLPLIE